MHSLCISIAGILTRVEWENDALVPSLNDAERKFLCDGGVPDLVMRVRVDGMPDFTSARVLFECTTWRLREIDGGRVMELGRFGETDRLHRAIILDDHLSTFDVIVPAEELERRRVPGPPGSFLAFEHPSLELITYWRLARERGMGLHAAGIRTDDFGLILAGDSGAGKSTMSALWQERGATVLSDDRVGVRPCGDGYRVYGTPWHGTLEVCDPSHAPLRAILLLAHGQRNEAWRVTGAAACAKIVSLAFAPYFADEDLRMALDAAAALVERIPCYRVNFIPEQSAIEYLLELLGSEAPL